MVAAAPPELRLLSSACSTSVALPYTSQSRCESYSSTATSDSSCTPTPAERSSSSRSSTSLKFSTSPVSMLDRTSEKRPVSTEAVRAADASCRRSATGVVSAAVMWHVASSPTQRTCTATSMSSTPW